MKNILTLLLAIISLSACQQKGVVKDNLSMKSKILNMERKYAIYLPPDYENTNRSYPVLYLLHGYGNDQSGWIQFGELKHNADQCIASGKSTAMIIVMPDANTKHIGYANSPKGDWQYENFFFDEFIPYIESTYRIRSEKRYRAIAGLSMGGWGAFIYPLHRPDMFAAACPLSAANRPQNIDKVKHLKWNVTPGTSDKEAIPFYYRNNILEQIDSINEENKEAVRWYIDCGDDDHLYEGNSLVHIKMRKNEIPHEYRVRDGAHNWDYWRESLPEVLTFVSKSFKQ